VKSLKSNLRAKLCAIAIAGLFLSAAAPILALQDMQNMPGMKMGKAQSKPKSKSKSTAAKRKPTRKRGGMSGMSMKRMTIPASSRAASRSRKAPARKMNMNMPAMAGMPAQTPKAVPSASPEQMNMPGMQMPQATPSPSGNNPTTNEQAKHDMQNMPGMNMGNTTTQPQPAQTNSMPGMDMSGQGNKSQSTNQQNAMPDTAMPGMKMSGTGRISSSDPNALMIMAGQQMDIRVGSSKLNFISMGQMGSGSSWQPSTTPMYMYVKVMDKWLLFIHGEAKLGVNSQGGPRGVTKFESMNWIMPMAFRRVGQGTLQLRGMFSLEPLTFAPGGTPELFQTGETYKGKTLVDKQHPHDLVMELSATYTMPLGERATWFTYLGYPGEPALGPVAFMHRWSASENPTAPLAHHLEDSTHISFGVLTTGFTYRKFKVEGSIFNGQEPDENRYNFEAHPWHSHSIRFSFAPNQNWTMQWSYGVLKRPEALEPDVNQRRMTASIQYNKLFKRGDWATSLIWGHNHFYGGNYTANLNGYTAESTVNFKDKNYVYTRLELVDKNELLRPEDRTLLHITDAHPNFRIGAYTFGAARDVLKTDKLSVALGGDVTFYSKPAILNPIYGNNPVSYKFFIRIRPSRMTMKSSGQ
jgi:hypothetical protein